MTKQHGTTIVSSPNAPKAVGPYSQAVKIQNLVYTAGQVGFEPASMEIAPGGVQAQTRQALNNLKNILAAAETSLAQVLKTTVFLTDMADFAAMNAVYSEFFPENPPARSTIAVVGLPKGALVEIEAVAFISEK